MYVTNTKRKSVEWRSKMSFRSSGQSVQSSICTYIQMAWVSSPTHSLTHSPHSSLSTARFSHDAIT